MLATLYTACPEVFTQFKKQRLCALSRVSKLFYVAFGHIRLSPMDVMIDDCPMWLEKVKPIIIDALSIAKYFVQSMRYLDKATLSPDEFACFRRNFVMFIDDTMILYHRSNKHFCLLRKTYFKDSIALSLALAYDKPLLYVMLKEEMVFPSTKYVHFKEDSLLSQISGYQFYKIFPFVSRSEKRCLIDAVRHDQVSIFKKIACRHLYNEKDYATLICLALHRNSQNVLKYLPNLSHEELTQNSLLKICYASLEFDAIETFRQYYPNIHLKDCHPKILQMAAVHASYRCLDFLDGYYKSLFKQNCQSLMRIACRKDNLQLLTWLSKYDQPTCHVINDAAKYGAVHCFTYLLNASVAFSLPDLVSILKRNINMRANNEKQLKYVSMLHLLK